jgi:hypothetical protein
MVFSNSVYLPRLKLRPRRIIMATEVIPAPQSKNTEHILDRNKLPVALSAAGRVA